LQFVGRDLLWRELGFETLFDLVETRLAVERAKQKVFFFFEAEVVQADRVFEDPVTLALITMLPGLDQDACAPAAGANDWKSSCRREWASVR